MPTFSSTLAHARAPLFLVPLLALLAMDAAQAANNFPISTPVTKAQTLAAGQSGSVTRTGTLTVGGSDVAVTMTGDNAALTNLGSITETGTGRAVRDNTGVAKLVVNNGSATNSSALMQTYDADVIQMAKTPASVTLNNWGTILSATTTGSSSDGVDVQGNTGVVVDNQAGGTIEGGRHGITGGAPDATSLFTTTVNNGVGATLRGDNGSGINLDGANGKESATITNHGTIIGNGITGDGDGVDVDGLVTLINTGVIRSLNAVPDSGEALAFSEGLSVGGGSITNSGTIEGLVATGNTAGKGVGITLTGNDIATGPNAGNRDGLYGNAVVINQDGGLIRGQNSSAIVAKGLASGYTVSISNHATSTIRGGGGTDAAIQLGADAASIANSGLIDGSSSKTAIAGGSGNLTIVVSGGKASILGDIVGGSGRNSMTIAPGKGNSFSYASGISNFDKVEIASGSVTFTGQSAYTGTTRIDSGATLVLSGGANRLATGGTLDLEGGTLRLANMPGANGQEFAVLSLGQDSAIDLGDSSTTFDALGSVSGGKTLSVTDWLASASPTYALRFEGDLTGNAAFRALMGETTIDGLAAVVHFDGRYTDVTAVPEPANVALLLAGLGLMGAVARRRKPGA